MIVILHPSEQELVFQAQQKNKAIKASDKSNTQQPLEDISLRQEYQHVRLHCFFFVFFSKNLTNYVALAK